MGALGAGATRPGRQVWNRQRKDEVLIDVTDVALGHMTKMRWNEPQDLAGAMHAAWISFATNGDPGWPRYDLGRRATMRFNTTSQVVNDPRAWERALWEGAR